MVVDGEGQDAQRRYSVKDYYSMVAAHIIEEHQLVEVVQGDIIARPALDPKQTQLIESLLQTLQARLGWNYIVRRDAPIRVDDYTELRPKIAIFHRCGDDTREQIDSGRVVLLIDLAKAFNGSEKISRLLLYARASVPEVWVLHFLNRTLERFGHLAPDGYHLIERVSDEQTLRSVALPSLAITLSDIFCE
jgi:Uma2 family endonuclease